MTNIIEICEQEGRQGGRGEERVIVARFCSHIAINGETGHVPHRALLERRRTFWTISTPNNYVSKATAKAEKG